MALEFEGRLAHQVLENLAFGEITEAKNIGSLSQGRTARDILLRPGETSLTRSRQGRASASERQARDELEKGLLDTIQRWRDGEFSFNRLKKEAREVLRRAYVRVFAVGMSIPGDILGRAEITQNEKKWIEKSVRSEARYLNRFLGNIRRGKVRERDVERRVKAYADALRSIYDAARVAGSPNMAVIYWITREDSAVCPGCQYLKDHSPYLRHTLPTTPRSGATPCRANCRCRLLIRTVDAATYNRVAAQQPRNPDDAQRDLDRIKRNPRRKGRRRRRA